MRFPFRTAAASLLTLSSLGACSEGRRAIEKDKQNILCEDVRVGGKTSTCNGEPVDAFILNFTSLEPTLIPDEKTGVTEFLNDRPNSTFEIRATAGLCRAWDQGKDPLSAEDADIAARQRLAVVKGFVQTVIPEDRITYAKHRVLNIHCTYTAQEAKRAAIFAKTP